MSQHKQGEGIHRSNSKPEACWCKQPRVCHVLVMIGGKTCPANPFMNSTLSNKTTINMLPYKYRGLKKGCHYHCTHT